MVKLAPEKVSRGQLVEASGVCMPPVSMLPVCGFPCTSHPSKSELVKELEVVPGVSYCTFTSFEHDVVFLSTLVQHLYTCC